LLNISPEYNPASTEGSGVTYSQNRTSAEQIDRQSKLDKSFFMFLLNVWDLLHLRTFVFIECQDRRCNRRHARELMGKTKRKARNYREELIRTTS